jgi:hypothetical protein
VAGGGGGGAGVCGRWGCRAAVVAPPVVSRRGGGPAGGVRGGPVSFFGNSPSPRAIWGSRHLCDESVCFASRQRGLCRPSGAEWAVPRVPSRHRLCREYLGLCRVELALGTAPDSGSGDSKLAHNN